MLKNTIINSEYFWKALSYFEQTNEEFLSVEEFLNQFQMSEERLLELVSFLNTFDYKLRLEKTLNGQRLLRLPNPKPNITLNLTFSQWLGVQVYMPQLSKAMEEAPKSLYTSWDDKLQLVHNQYPQYNFFKVLEREREKQRIFFKICNQKRSILDKIEDSVSNNLCLILSLKEGKSIEIYIHQVVFLDGGLSVVAEDVEEKCLVYFDLNNIENIRLSFKDNYRPTYTKFEISDFITSVRSVIGKEDRLVLKIKDQNKVSLNPEYQFLGNPFITSNTEGEIIWAASVERSEELYRWLDQIFDYVEILDPQNLINDYYQYRSLTSKKAS